jgi:hypothetical protein
MRSVKAPAYLLVAALVLVPSLARAAQKLDRRPDLKPSASFRDVDRPPERLPGQLDLSASLSGTLRSPSDCSTYAVIDADQAAAPRAAADHGSQALRAPPASRLA